MNKPKQGIIDHWDPAKGYGFIQAIQNSNRVFCHITDCDFQRHPEKGEAVEFREAVDKNGRYRAVRVRRVGQSRSLFEFWRVTLVLCYAIALGVLIALQRITAWVPVFVLCVSVVNYLVYWQDKRAAQLNLWRTREKTLHLLALFGGWPGALFAQRQLRHKSRKTRFQIIFWVSVLLHCVLIAALATNSGQQWLKQAWHIVGPLFS
ncbi:DNA-binding protein [Arenicella chitinivorans]|uniref:DNA-binding protein n=1 Tax=Arenicella chitinivorans TaxID=1329800 RepID=A0A918RN93_9GAMM|nr:DUF1294 domain-containing protein [Arenicella chitinivorans]GHA03365.1 DNA-binding protein [Arenicella chitinivorans]